MRSLILSLPALALLALAPPSQGKPAAPAKAVPVAEAPLRLDQVLRSSRLHAPQIVEALARNRQADGRQLAAEGAFDAVFSVDAQGRGAGYYDGSAVETKLSQPLGANGGSVYAAYRASRGSFPIYENQLYTNTGGEVKVGALFSLLRGRAIDERRFGIATAQLDRELAQLDAELVAIGVQRRAISAYQAWVIAGLRVRVYRDLVQLAEARQSSFAQQVERGARPQILLTENQQNLTRRRTLLARAEADLAAAANALSLFWRDDAGQPVAPSPDRLPGSLPAIAPANRLLALDRRPDLKALDVRLRQLGQRIEFERNGLLPRVDVRVEVARGLGATGPGGPGFNGTRAIFGLSVSVPIQQRGARGRIEAARAEQDALRARRQLQQEQVGVEFDGLLIDLSATRDIAKLAETEASLARQTAAAERRRFELGASDFFVVNLREEAAADAEIRRLDADYRRSVAVAELAAATVDTETLGL